MVTAVLLILMTSIGAVLLMERQSVAQERAQEHAVASTETGKEIWAHTLPTAKKAAAGRGITFRDKKKSASSFKTRGTRPRTKSQAFTSVLQTMPSEEVVTGAGSTVASIAEKGFTTQIKRGKSSPLTKSRTKTSVVQTTSSEEMETVHGTSRTLRSTLTTSSKRRDKSTLTSTEPSPMNTFHPNRNTPDLSRGLSTSAPATSVTLKPSLRAKRPLIVCVVGGQLHTTVPPPDGLCTFMIFEHVRVAKNSHDFVASSNQKAFDNFLKMAAGKKAEQFLLSLTSDLEYDESLEVGDHAKAIVRRYHDQNVCGYGFAHHRVLSTGIDSGKLWKHHSMLSNLRQWSKDPLVLFIGLEIFHHRSYSDVYVTGLLTEAAESMDFLILRVHVTTPPGLASRRCQVELISSWTKDTLNDKLLLTVEEATRVFNSSRLELNLTVPLLLSDSLAVVEYEVEKDPQAQRPRLLNLKCSKRTLQAFHTVCSSNFTYLRGARTKSTFCHYDDDPDNGRWRTYKTAIDMTNEIMSVAFTALSLVDEKFGWAFYDVDMEDIRGDCVVYWGLNRRSSSGREAAAYYRLKNAVLQLNSLGHRMSDSPKIQERKILQEAR